MYLSLLLSAIVLAVAFFYFKEITISRLFSALQIPQQTTQQLISLQNGLPNAQWINPQNFHVTLSFFGEVESAIADAIMHAFDTIKLPLLCYK